MFQNINCVKLKISRQDKTMIIFDNISMSDAKEKIENEKEANLFDIEILNINKDKAKLFETLTKSDL